MAPVAGVVLLVVHDERRGGGDRIAAHRNTPMSGIRPSLLTIRFSTRSRSSARAWNASRARGRSGRRRRSSCGRGGRRCTSRAPRGRPGGAATTRSDRVAPRRGPPPSRRSTRYAGPRETSTSYSPGRQRERRDRRRCGSSRTRTGARARSKPSSAWRQALVGREAPAVGPGDRDPGRLGGRRRSSATTCAPADGGQIHPPLGADRVPSAAGHVDDPERGVAALVGDVGDAAAVGRPARRGRVELAVGELERIRRRPASSARAGSTGGRGTSCRPPAGRPGSSRAAPSRSSPRRGSRAARRRRAAGIRQKPPEPQTWPRFETTISSLPSGDQVGREVLIDGVVVVSRQPALAVLGDPLDVRPPARPA